MSELRFLKTKDGHDIYIIDYIQTIGPTINKEEFDKIFPRWKNFCAELNKHLPKDWFKKYE